jgi:hypothetical protein
MTATNQVLGDDGSVALGDTHVLTFPITKDGAAYSPTVSAATFLAKTAVTDADAAAVITRTLGTGIAIVTSTATVTITPANQSALTATTTLYWALKIRESNGVESTLADGMLLLSRKAVVASP